MKLLTIFPICAVLLPLSIQAAEINDPIDGVIDRANGAYTFECRGYRTDTKTDQTDWKLSKENMDYVGFGVLSHATVDFVNKYFLEIGNKGLQAAGAPVIPNFNE